MFYGLNFLGAQKMQEDDRYAKFSTFPGPTPEEEWKGYRARAEARMGEKEPSQGQGSNTRIIGTPRRAKHKGGGVGGVRMR